MSNIGDQLLSIGTGAVGQAVNTGLGIIFGRSQEQHNDERQIAQQQKLQAMQIAGQKELTDYNEGKQIDLWNKTNAEAQMQHYKDAGLNPALMYGMGGGGGSTANIATGSVSGAEAPKGGHEQIDQQQIGMGLQQQSLQLQLLEAQKQNIEADTANKQADTSVKGAQKPNVEANTQNLLQGYDNLRMDYQIKELQIAAQNLANYKEQASQQDQLNTIHYNASQALRSLQILSNAAKESDATLQSKIQIVEQEAISGVLRNALSQAQIENTQIDSLLKNQQIQASITQLAQNATQLDINQQKVAIDRFSATIQANMPSLGQATGRILNDAIESIFKLFNTERGYHYQPKKK